jgi:hypothetical protein
MMGVYGDVSPAMWASYQCAVCCATDERATYNTGARKPIKTQAKGEDALHQHALDP